MLFLRTKDAVHAISPSSTSYRPLGTVRLDATTLVHIGDTRPYQSPVATTVPPYNVSVLKSNLQKCIRRGKANEALATARQLLLQDPNELLRRLPIILCEDTLLCAPLFCELVWLMVAVGKGYAINKDDAQIVYDAVQTMIDAPGRYNGSVAVSDVAGATVTDPIDSATDTAFRIRVAYGGMAGDCDLLERLRRRWKAGTLPQAPLSPATKAPEPFDPRRHVIPEAIDFHCFPALLTEHPELSKAAIWWHWSSINVRPPVGDGAAELVAQEAAERARHCWTSRSRLERYAAQKIAGLTATSTGTGTGTGTSSAPKKQSVLDFGRKAL